MADGAPAVQVVTRRMPNMERVAIVVMVKEEHGPTTSTLSNVSVRDKSKTDQRFLIIQQKKFRLTLTSRNPGALELGLVGTISQVH